MATKMVTMAIHWLQCNGDGRNGTDGAPHRHWHQWQSPLDPKAITIGSNAMASTIGDLWGYLNCSNGEIVWRNRFNGENGSNDDNGSNCDNENSNSNGDNGNNGANGDNDDL